MTQMPEDPKITEEWEAQKQAQKAEQRSPSVDQAPEPLKQQQEPDRDAPPVCGP
jgi:hypothetical protein